MESFNIAKIFEIIKFVLLSVSLFVQSLFTPGGISLTEIGYKLLKAFNTIDIQHYNMEVKIPSSFDKVFIDAEVDIKFIENNVDGIYLLLNSGYSVKKIYCEDKKIKFQDIKIPNSPAQILLLEFNSIFKKDDTVKLKLFYEGFSEGVVSYINKDGAELDIFSIWYPITGIEDAFTAVQKFITPSNFIAVGNGNLVEKKENYFIYQSNTPLFVMNFVLSKFEKQELELNNKKINFYFEHNEYKEEIINFIPEILNFYKNKFGDLEFNNINVIKNQNKIPSAYCGGNNIILHKGLFDTGIKKEEKNKILKLYYLLAHETAHLYWGSTAGPKILNGGFWLVEGLAEYSALLAVEQKFIKDDLKKLILEIEIPNYKDYLSKGPHKSISEASFFEGNQGSLFYYKGALLFHTLRYIVGDENFYKILHTYYNRFKFQFADIDDFQKICEEVSGKNLNYYFDNFLKSTKECDLSVSDGKCYKDKNNYKTEFIVENKGEIRIPDEIEILVLTEKEGIKIKRVLDKEINKVSVETKTRTKEIIIDPDLWILDIKRENNKIQF